MDITKEMIEAAHSAWLDGYAPNRDGTEEALRRALAAQVHSMDEPTEFRKWYAQGFDSYSKEVVAWCAWQARAALQAGSASGAEPEWVTKLRQELMLSKVTHGFTFSRDELMELLVAKPLPIAQCMPSKSVMRRIAEQRADGRQKPSSTEDLVLPQNAVPPAAKT